MIVIAQGLAVADGIESLGGIIVTVVGAIYLIKSLSMSDEDR